MSYLQMQQQSNFFHGFPKNDQRINLPKHLCHLYDLFLSYKQRQQGKRERFKQTVFFRSCNKRVNVNNRTKEFPHILKQK